MPKSTRPERIERELARLLKERREALELSKLATAQRAGLAPMTVTFVEERARRPTVHTLLQIAEVLDVDLWEILKAATAAAKRQAGG